MAAIPNERRRNGRVAGGNHPDDSLPNSSLPFELRDIPALDLLLRIPPLFVIDSLLNTQFGFQNDLHIVPASILSVMGIWLAVVVIVLPSKHLRLFYAALCGVYTLLLALLWNRTFTQRDILRTTSGPLELLCHPELQLHLAGLLLLTIVHHTLMGISLTGTVSGLRFTLVGTLLALPSLLPLLLPPDTPPVMGHDPVDFALRTAGGVLLIDLAVRLLSQLGGLGRAARSAYLHCQSSLRFFGLQYFLDEHWGRLRLPDLLRLFWVIRSALQAYSLLSDSDLDAENMMWTDAFSTLLVRGCDTIVALAGMSAVISYLSFGFGVCIQKFIGERSNEEEHVGTVSAVLFFILALQTGLTGLPPEERFTRLCRNLFLLLTAILHFIHNMVSPVLMSLSAQPGASPLRHLRVLLVCLALLTFSPWFMLALWSRHSLGTWLLAVSCFCVEVCVKTLATLAVYALFVADARRSAPWERLDDYVYYVRAAGSSVEFLFGVFLLLNGAWIMCFESGGLIRATMMCMHAYFNIWQQARQGWKVLINRRSALAKINALPDATPLQLREYDDLCAVCYQQLLSAKVTACRHYFHEHCLRKWLYVQDKCPLCHSLICLTITKDDSNDSASAVIAAAAQ